MTVIAIQSGAIVLFLMWKRFAVGTLPGPLIGAP
jgi:hypothetical protein